MTNRRRRRIAHEIEAIGELEEGLAKKGTSVDGLIGSGLLDQHTANGLVTRHTQIREIVGPDRADKYLDDLLGSSSERNSGSVSVLNMAIGIAIAFILVYGATSCNESNAQNTQEVSKTTE